MAGLRQSGVGITILLRQSGVGGNAKPRQSGVAFTPALRQSGVGKTTVGRTIAASAVRCRENDGTRACRSLFAACLRPPFGSQVSVCSTAHWFLFLGQFRDGTQERFWHPQLHLADQPRFEELGLSLPQVHGGRAAHLV